MAEERDQIKVPQKASIRKGGKVARALTKTPQDGEWHKLFSMGFSTAEQTARAWNSEASSWELGYTIGDAEGNLVSYLWARWTSG